MGDRVDEQAVPGGLGLALGLLTPLAAAVAVAGPGRWSLDHALGLELSGVVTRLTAVALGVAGGWLRWATRSTDG